MGLGSICLSFSSKCSKTGPGEYLLGISLQSTVKLSMGSICLCFSSKCIKTGPGEFLLRISLQNHSKNGPGEYLLGVSLQSTVKMGFKARKPVFMVSDQVIAKSACSVTDTS